MNIIMYFLDYEGNLNKTSTRKSLFSEFAF